MLAHNTRLRPVLVSLEDLTIWAILFGASIEWNRSLGTEVLEHAQRSAEVSEAVTNIASNHLSKVSGTLRIAAPPSISDSLLAPLVGAFQASYPDVRAQIFITERIVDQIAEGVDVAFRVGELEDSSLIVRRLLTYRHQLVASPAYLKKAKPPETPNDLLGHRL